MNRICAAGTGSFLEEQAERLGMDIIDEFAQHALAAEAPADLGRRCTVFMDSELVHALAAGAALQDVAAGLALSVVRNYLDRVVGGRPIGQQVVFQGGTASNRAVVAAFRQVLGKPVRVHPHNRVSGALGAALLLLDARREGQLPDGTRFRGIDACRGELELAFECKRCSNRCQVTRFRSGDEVFHFGDACERYAARDGAGARQAPPDPLARRLELLLSCARLDEDDKRGEGPVLGIPRASLGLGLLPLWTALARAAGRQPLLSPPTSARTLAAGMRAVASDTCLPVKLAYGHALQLQRRGAQAVLLPAVGALEGEEGLSGTCPYTQHLPWMLAGHLDAQRLMAPEVELDAPERLQVTDPQALCQALGLEPAALQAALAEGRQGLARFREQLQAWGRAVLEGDEGRILVVMGRPYTLSDPFLNMGLGRHLARLGLTAIPMDCLPLEQVELEERWRDLPWGYNRDLIRAATLLQQDERLFPLVLSSFGCGPDAFTHKHLESMLQARPRLFLELDEHRAEAGLITRLEAFADEIDAQLRRQKPQRAAPAAPQPEPSRRLHIPYFADHVHGYIGIMRAAGYQVNAFPPPDAAVRERGEALVSGRECHPFAMFAGELVSWLERGEAQPDDVFFYPGTVVSCLLRQYRDGLDLLLQRLGAERLTIVTPNLDEWADIVGMRLSMRLHKALMASDVLLRARCRIRPYEREKGRTDAVYQQSLQRLAQSAEEGALSQAMAQCAAQLAAIPRHDGPRRPVVGVAGDLYTRTNDFASDGLMTQLEAAGCEVWPAPFSTDVAEYNASQRIKRAWQRRRLPFTLRSVASYRVMASQRQRMEGHFRCIEGLRGEPSMEQVRQLARPYLAPEASSLVVLNIAKMVDYARGGAAGILNASCINCMVGSISEALQQRLRRDLGGLPMATLVYGGGDGTVDRARLEAFLHQVRRFHAGR